MKTAVIGFPRIGALRELKFSSEKYFRNEITEEELLETGRTLRKTHWKIQKEPGIDYISCNDFSYYDGILDAAVMCGIIPKRYQELNLSELDTYFAMARGYQGEAGDVKALAMKKWFNTNYHYIVPEVEDDTVISFSGKKLLSEFEEAKELGILVKPVVPGAYTLLKLCRYTGTKTAEDFVDDVIFAYKELLKLCDKNEVSWIQFDEPSLVFDMTEQDLALFRKIYSEILPSAQSCQVLVQTYFGDVRDVYQDLIQLPFAGVGLDFVEGKQTKKLIEQYGFPKDKILFAGLVNGKNIWKNHYKETLQALQELKEKGIDTVLSTSCSLLHVPYTIEQEKELSDEYKKHFAFAKEKLSELRDLKVLAENENFLDSVLLKANESLFLAGRDCVKEEVKNRLKQVKDEDYVRTPARKERQKRQKEVLGLPIFPTTTIGSFPQTKDVKANRSAYRRGKKTKEEYVAFNREKISECIRWQEEHPADRRRTACGPQRAVHVARDRADRPADRADEGSFRRCGDRVPFPADRQPSGGRLPPPDRRKRRPARRGRSLIGAAAAPPPVVGDRRRGTREQFQAGRFGSPVSRARYGRHARGALRRQDAAGQRDAFGRVLF